MDRTHPRFAASAPAPAVTIKVVASEGVKPGEYFVLPGDIVARLEAARTPADVEAIAAEVAKRSRECAVVKVRS